MSSADVTWTSQRHSFSTPGDEELQVDILRAAVWRSNGPEEVKEQEDQVPPLRQTG